MGRKAIVLTLCLLFSSRFVTANAPPPPPRPETPPTPAAIPAEKITKFTSPVEIKRADLSKEGAGVVAKVSLPRKTFTMVQPTRRSELPWMTIIAGLALATGAAAMLLAARGSMTGRRLAFASVVVALVSGSHVLADLRVPPPEAKIADNVVIEITDGDVVVITLPKE